eukprot:TRINITY_DN5798_c0_g1_i2.p1 TRINITY_DN5798_c0_g1~~TRINITY_DN5798_c0_g1_i2.p1  ORF type:complete len:159 (-),score=25.40 TRINITY_DN5798_c0_g1_i2:56-532(-)
MESELRTKVDEKYFGKKIIVRKVLRYGQQYICQAIHNNTLYTIEGYQILLEPPSASNDYCKTKLMEALKSIGDACHEYSLHIILPCFNPHILKSLEIDYEVEVKKDGSDFSYLYIEILFEYGGKLLLNLENTNIPFIYNLMRQAISACLLYTSDAADE